MTRELMNSLTQSLFGRRSGVGRLGALLLLGLAGMPACGKTSFFDVTMTIKQNPDVQLSELVQVDSCVVEVSGPDSGSYDLNQFCDGTRVTSYNLGIFQYGTEKDSGNFTFKVTLRSANKVALGSGTSAPVAVISGGRASTSVEIQTDANAFPKP